LIRSLSSPTGLCLISALQARSSVSSSRSALVYGVPPCKPGFPGLSNPATLTFSLAAAPAASFGRVVCIPAFRPTRCLMPPVWPRCLVGLFVTSLNSCQLAQPDGDTFFVRCSAACTATCRLPPHPASPPRLAGSGMLVHLGRLFFSSCLPPRPPIYDPAALDPPSRAALFALLSLLLSFMPAPFYFPTGFLLTGANLGYDPTRLARALSCGAPYSPSAIQWDPFFWVLTGIVTSGMNSSTFVRLGQNCIRGVESWPIFRKTARALRERFCFSVRIRFVVSIVFQPCRLRAVLCLYPQASSSTR